MRSEISLTDEQLESFFESLTGDVFYLDDLVLTRETISDFLTARSKWSESGSVVRQTSDQLCIEKMQIRRGDPRKTLWVVDFGTVRGCASR